MAVAILSDFEDSGLPAVLSVQESPKVLSDRVNDGGTLVAVTTDDGETWYIAAEAFTAVLPDTWKPGR